VLTGVYLLDACNVIEVHEVHQEVACFALNWRLRSFQGTAYIILCSTKGAGLGSDHHLEVTA